MLCRLKSIAQSYRFSGSATILRRFISIGKEEQLSFAVLTPKSLAKARVGGILARLLSTPGLNFVGARMISPSHDLLLEWGSIIRECAQEDNYIDDFEEAHTNYVEIDLRADVCASKGIPHQIMLLLFSGHDTRKKLDEVVGENLPPPSKYGLTIRGAYGDYARLSDGTVLNFQPAVLTAPTDKSNRSILKMFSKYLEKDGGVLPIADDDTSQTCLVMIKPDNLERPSSLPGHIIDLFGTTGLVIVGTRVFSMSLNQGREFYGFLEHIFENKLKILVEKNLRSKLEKTFDFALDDSDYSQMADILKKKNARCEMNKIIGYMTGVNPSIEYTPLQLNQGGPAKCFALLFRGPNAINLIRAKLGATDPSKAEVGTIRTDYGKDLMRNGAHASDSPENALRERKIVGLLGNEISQEKILIENWLAETE